MLRILVVIPVLWLVSCNAYSHGLPMPSDDWKQARLLVRRIAENFRLPYYTLTPTFSICPVHGYIAGEHKFCPYEHSQQRPPDHRPNPV